MKVSRSSRHRVMKTQMKILKIIEKMVTIQSIKSKQQHIFNHSLIFLVKLLTTDTCVSKNWDGDISQQFG
jgi:hypothetical protein